MARRCFPLNSLCLALVFSFVLSAPAQSADIARLMAEGDVPGLSMAVIRDGKIAQVSAYGFRNTATGQPVDEHTIFNAASLSKPVFAYAVLQLADAGKLPLDAPLSYYLPNYIPNDPRGAAITARQVLSHTSGLPNGINDTYPLKTYFAPGERFSYSGEAISICKR